MSGKKINNKEHNMTNPYDFDKLEYEKGYKGCAKSGSGIPIVNKLFGRSLCDLGIGTKEHENNRNRDWLEEALNGGPKLPENQPKPTSNPKNQLQIMKQIKKELSILKEQVKIYFNRSRYSISRKDKKWIL